jgi:hypothetical protein
VQGSPVTGEQHLRTATARQRCLVLLDLELLIDHGRIEAINFSWGKVQIEIYF